MLKILIPTLMLAPVPWVVPQQWLWTATLAHSLLIALISLSCLGYPSECSWAAISMLLAVDPISAPLLALSCWLLPLMILASQGHMRSDSISRQRTYISAMVFLQSSLIIAFTSTELMLFYIAFEATLLPTMVLIARWGNQPTRITATNYFLFYTLAGSVPLLIALLMIQKSSGTLSLIILPYCHESPMAPNFTNLWWIACMAAFLIKLPLYGAHLWLPKAHVEAPVAGSMVLAAVLLKLGGYGMMRIMMFISPMNTTLTYPFIVVALWGVVMASTMCLRQTDLKSLVAYSSVSHMGLVAGGILIQTQWGFTGALTLMIAHGLTSSALFCLANFNYERTQTRTIKLTRGLSALLPAMTMWWFIASAANLALPPLPNLMGELMIISSLFHWCDFTIMLSGLGTIITGVYSLYMFLMIYRGPVPSHMLEMEPTHSREHLLILLHLVPLILLIAKPDFTWAWMN
uniref:NADH dehydrogenase subunit 4 n=1 Tax=Ophidion muraenolepis TaxID=2589338 RepID=UPI0028FCCF6D|nr:NADH dehydrogenase subunit 4 [Ophidion muraenolepis]WNH38090.1 NADH dehydrogenase subunit 4 [Ophidion muraenolepis]